MTLSRTLGRRRSRRRFLQRSAAVLGGGAALALAGCAEDESPAQPRPAAQEQAVQQVSEQVSEQASEQSSEQAGSRVEQSAAAEPTQTLQQAQQVGQVQQTQQGAPSQDGQPEPPAERRLLVPDLEADDYQLQDPAFDPIAGARVDFGEIEGAGYRIELPEQWNGELVLWAHGFRGLDDAGAGFSRRLTFDDIPARDAIIGQGYGWATSTYRANGYVPGLGVDDLLRVKDRVAEVARAPRRTYIAGGSMGGATAQLMAQEFPEEIAAALALCPALGNVWVVDYTVAWHALAHWLIGYPPEQLDSEGLRRWAEPLGRADEHGLLLTDAGRRFAAVIKDFSGGERWGFDEGLRQQWNIAFGLGATIWPGILADSLSPGALIPVSEGQPPADTRNHIYSAAADAGIDLERLNAEVIRVASPPERRNDPGVGLPTGALKRPMIAIKTTGDLFTPIHLDRDYQKLVADSGWGSNLVAQAVRRGGHCAFSEREALSGFTAIIAWLSFGFAPAGDDLQGDLSEVGTRFTDPFDEDDPLRPTT